MNQSKSSLLASIQRCGIAAAMLGTALPGTSFAQDLIGANPKERTRNFNNLGGIAIADSCPDPESEECIVLPDYYFDNNIPVPIIPADPYPASIEVPSAAFVTGSKITDVNVRIQGLSHGSLDDVDILLVGPEGQYAVLASNVGGGTLQVEGLNWKFDDAARLPLPNSSSNTGRASTRETNPLYNLIYDEWVDVWLTTSQRTFKPSDYDTSDDPDQYPAPAPQSISTPPTVVQFPPPPFTDPPVVSGGSPLGTFNGKSPVGTWKLFVVDDLYWFDGSLGGWAIEITAAAP